VVVYKRTLFNVELASGVVLPQVSVCAYNDSNAEWVVLCNGHTERFKQTKFWTMKRSMRVAAEIWGEK